MLVNLSKQIQKYRWQTGVVCNLYEVEFYETFSFSVKLYTEI